MTLIELKMSLNELRLARISLNAFKSTLIGLIDLRQAQMSMTLNGRRSTQMSLNKSKRA